GGAIAGADPRQQLRTVAGCASRILFDAQELVVLGDAVRAAGRAGLDLPRVRRHGDVGDGGVLGLAAAMADDRRVMVAPGQLDRFQRFGQRADLVYLDENAVRDLLVDAVLQAFRVGDEQIVADELHAVAERRGQFLPAGPVVLGEPIFNRADRPAGR